MEEKMLVVFKNGLPMYGKAEHPLLELKARIVMYVV